MREHIRVVVVVHHHFSLHKIGYISSIVDSSGVHSGASPCCSPPRDNRETDWLVEETHELVHSDVALDHWGDPPWRDSLHREILHDLPVPDETLIFHKIDSVAAFHAFSVLVEPLLGETEIVLVRKVEPCAASFFIGVKEFHEVLDGGAQLGVIHVADRPERDHFDLRNFIDVSARGEPSHLILILDCHQEVLVHYIDDSKDTETVEWSHSPLFRITRWL